MWFVRNVRHVCKGGLRCRTTYFATVDLESSNPSFKSSPWIRGAPHLGFARLILRISSMTSPETEGRPRAWRLFQLQYSRNPFQRQPMTVSGLTTARVDRQPPHKRESQAQSRRSANLN